MKLTYKEAKEKIFDAYFKDEIQPFNTCFCFCGTLCDNNSSWYNFHAGLHCDGMLLQTHYPSHGYSGEELKRMEYALLRELPIDRNNYEVKLFEGMCSALEVLKEIHKSRGENVDEEIPFVKRDLKIKSHAPYKI